MSKQNRTLTILEVVTGTMTSEEIAKALLLGPNDKLEGRRVRHIVADLAQGGYLEAVPGHKKGSSRKGYRLTTFGEAILFEHRKTAQPVKPGKAAVEPTRPAALTPIRRFKVEPETVSRQPDAPPAVLPHPGPAPRMPAPPAAASAIRVGKPTSLETPAPTLTAQNPQAPQDNLVAFPVSPSTTVRPPETRIVRPAPEVSKPADIPQIRDITAPVSADVRLAVLEDRMGRFERRLEDLVRNLDAVQDAFVAVAAAINLGFKRAS